MAVKQAQGQGQAQAQGEALVAIGAHADDIELHAGAIAARWAAAGRPVHFVMATNNISGALLPADQPEAQPRRLGPKQTQAIRHREQEAAAACIGAQVHYLNYPQRHYWDGQREVSLDFRATSHDPFVMEGDKPPLIIAAQEDEQIDAVASVLVRLRPAVVLTQTITDVDPEHHATASLVWQAMRRRAHGLAGVPLLFWAPGTSSMAGMLRQSFDCVVAVSEADFEMKMRMLRCHASQMTRRRLEMAERRCRYWGAEVGAGFAEPLTTVIGGISGAL